MTEARKAGTETITTVIVLPTTETTTTVVVLPARKAGRMLATDAIRIGPACSRPSGRGILRSVSLFTNREE